MIILIIFAFLSGIVTILSPCILPVLPIVLSGTLTGNKKRPLGIITGFVLSFSIFTLILATLVRLTNISADYLRVMAIVIVFIFGLSLTFNKLQHLMEKMFGILVPNQNNGNNGKGFLSGLVLGLGIGLIWTPCVGPIVGSVIALAASSKVGLASIFITLSYSLGTALPMLAITYGGRNLLNKTPFLVNHTALIQKLFGIIMIIVAISLFFNIDRKFQTYILNKFPNYGTGITAIENNDKVNKAIENTFNNNIKPDQNIDYIQSMYPNAPELIEGGKWFNTKPLKLSELKGKVVIIDFWTYTCINCIRTLPYIEKWYEKYKDKGLVIIGVHTPEFEFEKNPDNVQKAINDFGLTYPIMQDNEYATWNAYKNRYWPAKYFIDKNGKIRDTHFGEGDYDQSEKIIQKLLGELGSDVSNMPIDNKDYSIYAQTPETYLGYARMQNIYLNQKVQFDKETFYTQKESNLPKNYFTINGIWNIHSENSNPSSNATLTFNFTSKNVYLVIRPVTPKINGKTKVYLDEKLIEEIDAGSDVKNAIVTVDEDKLYHLVKLQNPGNHILKLEFLDNNVEVFAFTFG